MKRKQILREGKCLTIYGYVKETGRCEADEFLKNLEGEHQVRTYGLIDRIVNHGIPRNTEKYKHLEGKIYEIKPYPQRLLCFQDGKDLIVTHCFTKKRQKTPRRQIEKAQRIYEQFIEETGGEHEN